MWRKHTYRYTRYPTLNDPLSSRLYGLPCILFFLKKWKKFGLEVFLWPPRDGWWEWVECAECKEVELVGVCLEPLDFKRKKFSVYIQDKREDGALQLHHRSNRPNWAIQRYHRSVRDSHRTEHSFGGCIKKKAKSQLESRRRGSELY